MFTSRKPLAIALTLVIMLAMLVPTAMAAPELAHPPVAITAPTNGAPVYVNPDQDGNSITVAFTLPVVGTQVDNVRVDIYLLQKYIPDPSNIVLQDHFTIAAKDLVTGNNKLTPSFLVNDVVAGAELLDGPYDLKVCVKDVDPNTGLFCDTQVSAVFVQDTYPKVDLEKPGVEEYHGATFVTGKDYLMVGTATDDWGIAAVEFQYCDLSTNPSCWGAQGKQSPSWIKIADGVPTAGVPHQWQATWDSTAVPDDFGAIRMCATNLVGLSNCTWGPDAEDATRSDAHAVFVNNRYVIDLEPGWNLLSSPLLPYDTSITSVLQHLIWNGTVLQVAGNYDPTAAPASQWQTWAPTGPTSLATIEDGKGYWIQMAAEDKLTIVGTWKSVGAIGPPEYNVLDAWNLIGYTQWGWPTFFPTKVMLDYLGPTVAPNAQALYLYDANAEVYHAVHASQHMTQGAGYWLATTQNATIRP